MATSLPSARILLDTNRVIAPISPLIFSGFLEHMGRAVYEGIYDPASPHADERGFRRDVLDVLRQLNYRSIRYPGGNFLSGYQWRDGIGPRDQRPRRRDLAWKSIETNAFGTDEFLAFCKAINAQPMLGVNLGTGTVQDAADLVEYCNAPVGTKYADMRATNGHPEPYGVKLWCLGNEMDGPWQMGQLDAASYAVKARESGKLMRMHDPSIQLISCGSSSTWMPTYPQWDRIVLESCWDLVDYHSLHYYARNDDADTPSYLAQSAQFEGHLETLTGVLRYVKSLLRSKRDVYLSWDEWNVWYKDTTFDGEWTEAPHLSEEVYNLEDALVVAQWLNVFLRWSHIVKIACLAQIVNTISPLHTTRDAVLKHTTYYPIALFSRLASGVALDVAVKAPVYPTAKYGDISLLDVSASLDPATDAGAVFMVNRSLSESLAVELVWQDRAPSEICGAHQLSGADPKAYNTLASPGNIAAKPIAKPVFEGRNATMVLPPLSFTAIETKM